MTIKRQVVFVLALSAVVCVFAAQGPKRPMQKAAVVKERLMPVALTPELREETQRYGLRADKFERNGTVLYSLLYSPKQKGVTRFPLVVYIPGNGEIGDPINQFRQRLIFERMTSKAFQQEHPCHFLAISPPSSAKTLRGGRPGAPTPLQQQLHDLVKEIQRVAVPKVDPSRIYLTGFSYGGGGAYALALHFPTTFAAVVPIATLPPAPEYLDPKHPGNWWHVHNEEDYARHGVRTDGLKKFRDGVNAAGGDFRLGTYVDQGHDAWTKTWQGNEIWDWMFSKALGSKNLHGRKAAPPTKTYAMSLSDVRCSASVAGRDAKTGPERALDGLDETAYVPSRAMTKDDWWMIEFPRPVNGKVRILSGDKDGLHRLDNAVCEVSSNGHRCSDCAATPRRDTVRSYRRSPTNRPRRGRPSQR